MHVAEAKNNQSLISLSTKGAMWRAFCGLLVLLVCPTPASASFESLLGHLRCPFSSLWVEHGPERAAEILGVSGHVSSDSRRLLEVGAQMNGTGRAEGPDCTLAPGPMGAAHQLGMSSGYGNNCEGTPAQQSPFMWPEAWTAKVESKSLDYNTGETRFTSSGRVWYRLDKNWKRSDIHYREGLQFGLGQSPCPKEDQIPDTPNMCRRHPTHNSTMLHRGSKLISLVYAPGKFSVEDIVNCTVLNVGIIGNVRPDWFMDKRGASTDVQYIGNSHVFYLGEPKLVKQWRKKDFASQYFTMSMSGYANDDGVHWPLIMNVPGEGFGDDVLVNFEDHRIVADSEEHEFLLDEAYMAMGGTCYERPRGSGAPTQTEEDIPSKLEKEEVSWRSVEQTFSPVYTPPAQPSQDGGAAPQPKALEIADGVEVKACMDGDALKFELEAQTDMPVWMAVGFRDTEECVMTPRGGGDGEVVWVQPEMDGEVTVKFGMLPAEVRYYNPETSAAFLASVQPFEATLDMSEGSASFQDGKMTAAFTRSYSGAVPESFHLNFAHGDSPLIAYHPARACFKLSDLPSCGGEDEVRSEVDCSAVCSESCGSAVPQMATGASVESSASSLQLRAAAGALLAAALVACFIG